jgi:hypothetical protein
VRIVDSRRTSPMSEKCPNCDMGQGMRCYLNAAALFPQMARYRDNFLVTTMSAFPPIANQTANIACGGRFLPCLPALMDNARGKFFLAPS